MTLHVADLLGPIATVPPTVASAMVRFPKVCGPVTSVADAVLAFGDPHVHALLVVEGPRLLTVVERADLAGMTGSCPVLGLGRTRGRVVGPDADLDATRRWMVEGHRRRLAVVGPGDRLLGLLCLKRSANGFCSDEGIRGRRAGR